MAATVLEASRASDVAAILRDAARTSSRLLVRGAATKLSWRDDSRSAADILSTKGLVEAIGHDPGDLVATIPAGITLRDANRVLAAAGQWLPLDCPHEESATIGGIVAANDSGPRRLKYGSPRDLIIGMEAALSTGAVVHAGGRVVKNVAGYDLSRLFCGSLGALGVITRATFKLSPLPAASRTLHVRAESIGQALEFARALSETSLTPTAVEIAAPDTRLLIRFESSVSATEQMADAAVALLAGRASRTDVSVLSGDTEVTTWSEHTRLTVSSAESTVPSQITRLKVSVVPTALAAVVDALEREAEKTLLKLSLVVRAALGVAYVNISGDVDRHGSFAQTAAAAATRAGGHAVALEFAHGAARVRIGVPEERIRRLMAAVAYQFDPANVLGGREHFGATA